jgi:hypothetical protein
MHERGRNISPPGLIDAGFCGGDIGAWLTGVDGDAHTYHCAGGRRGLKNGFLLEKRMETNRRFHED